MSNHKQVKLHGLLHNRKCTGCNPNTSLFIVVTRACGVLEWCIFSIPMAVAYKVVVIGLYGRRDSQAIDIRGFHLTTYFLSRLVTASRICPACQLHHYAIHL